MCYIPFVSHQSPSLPIQDPEPAAIARGASRPSLPADVGLRFIGEPEDQAHLFAAFALASATFGEVKKETKGQVGNQTFKYADLAAIMKIARPALAKNGIVLIQAFGPCPKGDSWMRATSVLAGHGAMIRTEFDFLHAEMMQTSGGGIPLQKLGVAQGYIRRMQAQALLGISPDDDPDKAPDLATPSTYQKQSSPPPNTRRASRKPPQNKPPAKAQGKTEAPPPPTGEVAAPISTAPPTPKTEERPPVDTVELPSPVTNPEPVVETEVVEEPEASLEVTDAQKAGLRHIAKKLGLSKLPQINGFIKKYLDPNLTIGDLDGPQVATLIGMLNKRAEALNMGSN